MSHAEPIVHAVARIPLSRAVLCLEDFCETVYCLGEDSCPACGSRAFRLLVAFLAERRTGR
jgi:hypothetical protein